MKLTDFEALTLDCYGTLIDWEAGICQAIRPWAAKHGVQISDRALLETFARLESEEEAGHPKKLYSDVLHAVHLGLARHFGVSSDEGEAAAFSRSIRDWPPFPDTVTALQYLHQHYKLCVLSNVDRASFAHSQRKLGVTFHTVISAEEVGSYKPDLRTFRYLLDRLQGMGIRKERVLHTAQSLFHDIVPAKSLGIATMWIDRRHGHDGWGATPPPSADVKPDFVAASLEELARRHRQLLGA